MTFKLQNTGDGSARINSADSISITYGSQYQLSRSSAQVFPLTIVSGDSAIFTYNVAVNNNATTGPDTFDVSVGYNDVASGRSFTVTNPAVYADWNVLEKATLNITAINAPAANVSQGQTGLTVAVQIENTGEVPAIIGSADSIGLQFSNNNNYTTVYVSPALPDTIAPLANNSYNFTVNVNAAAATGIDSIRGFVSGRNLRTNSVTSATGAYLDGWNVQSPPDLVITRIYSDRSAVNNGQQDLTVQMRILNQGQATAVFDSAGLYSLPPGLLTDTLAAVIDSIPSGARDTLFYNVDLAAYTGSLDIDGFINYYDANNPASVFSDSGAVNPLTWTVNEQSDLVMDEVTISPQTVSMGQSGISGLINISNTGQAAARIDSVALNFILGGGDANSNFVITKNASPSLPFTLSGGQNTTIGFTVATNIDAPCR